MKLNKKFSKNNLSKEKKICAKIYFSIFQTSLSRKVSSIFSTSAIEFRGSIVKFQNLFRFFVLILDKTKQGNSKFYVI